MSVREIISPSLLARVDTQDSKTPKQFSLGMSEWTGSDDEGDKENEDFQPERKKNRKSLSCKRTDRFAKSLPDVEYAKMTKRMVPKNTQKNTGWAMRNFHEWREQRNKRHPTEQCRADILESTPWDPEELKTWLCRFATETRRADGGKYPAHTLYQLLSGLLRYMREVDPDCPNFLEKKNHKFMELHAVLDNMSRQLRQEGIGAEVKHATLVTAEEEKALWDEGILGTDCPKSLLRAVFYLNGVNLCLRGGSEHRNLKLSQFQRLGNPDRYIYTENGSKNHSGSMSERSIQNKQVPIYSTYDTVGQRCHVHVLDLYISKMPEKAKQNDWLYLRPFFGKASTGAWYCASPIGEHTLRVMVKEMFKEIGVHDKTNHSLRATGASTLFQSAVPEKIIQERTGHRSIKALRLYERTTAHQNQQVSKVLATRSTPSPLTWEKESTSAGSTSVQGAAKSSSFPQPLFGSAQNCTININYGPSHINVAQDYRKFDDVEFPDQVEKELACIEF